MTPDPFAGVPAFLAVAEAGSFTAAAARLGVSTAAISQAVRGLEVRVGTPLFARTTRRVGLTEAGAVLRARLRPAATEIAEALAEVAAHTATPRGHLRLTVPRIARDVLVAVLPPFRAAYPDISVEVSVNDRAVDLVADGFDAGIRIIEAVERDMVAVPLTGPVRWVVVGSPAYFAGRGRPAVPEDLSSHDCIRYRFPASGTLYRWEFEREGTEFSIGVSGALVVDDGMLALDFVRAGMGLFYTSDWAVRSEIESGRLELVLERFSPRTAGLQLYFPQRTQAQLKLRAFIDTARRVLRERD